MKKTLTAAISIMSLTVALAIGSFAWYKMPNNGLLSTDVGTKTKNLDIYFNETQSAQSSIIPAKLKKGVLNDVSGSIHGDTDQVPRGRLCLPKIDENYNYILTPDGRQFAPNGEYLVHPASVIYNQFQLRSGSSSSDPNARYGVKFNYDIEYFNVDENGGQDSVIQKFGQKDALAFNFYLSEGVGLTDEQLRTATIADTDISNKKTIENVFAENSSTIRLIHNKNYTLSNGTLTNSQVKNYRFEPIATQKVEASTNKTYYTYSVEIHNLKFNTTYYVILESFYSIPGALVEGNLPLTGRFIIKLDYDPIK